MISVFVLIVVCLYIYGVFLLPNIHGSDITSSPALWSAHKSGEKFVVKLPAANGGTTQAEIMMMGSYQSNYGESNNGYSWYYEISIKNVGDKGIQLPMSESAEDNAGISVYIDQLYNGHYITLHLGELGESFGGAAIMNKIYLLQNQKNPKGGGIYHFNLGGTIIDFIIPEMSSNNMVLATTRIVTSTTSLSTPTSTVSAACSNLVSSVKDDLSFLHYLETGNVIYRSYLLIYDKCDLKTASQINQEISSNAKPKTSILIQARKNLQSASVWCIGETNAASARSRARDDIRTFGNNLKEYSNEVNSCQNFIYEDLSIVSIVYQDYVDTFEGLRN